MNSIDRDLRPKIIAGAAIVLLALAGAIFGLWYSAQARLNAPETLLANSNAALANGDFKLARELAVRSLGGEADPTPALILAGKAAAAEDDLEGALGYFAQVPQGSGSETVEALVAAGELAGKLGRASESEKHLRSTLAGNPGHLLANKLLADLLSLEGRSFEAAPFMFAPIQLQGEAPLEHLALLGGAEPIVENRQHLERFLSNRPDDVRPLIAKARVAMNENRLLEARRLLERIVKAEPEQIEAQARYGEVLLAEAPERLDAWRKQLPSAATGHPVVWLVRGQAAERDGQPEVAARCYLQAIELDPTHAAATYLLGQTLGALGRPEAETIAARAAALREIATVADDIRRSPPTADDPSGLNRLERAAALTEQLGRVWEACAWTTLAGELGPQTTPWTKEVLARLLPQLSPTTPRTLAAVNPARTLNMADFPLPSDAPPLTAEDGI